MVKVKESAVRIYLSGPRDDLMPIIDGLKFRPPDYWRSDAYLLFKQSGGKAGWNGYNYPVKFVPKSSTEAIALRGFLADVKALCAAHSITLDLSECLTSPFAGLTVDDIPDDIIKAPFLLDYNQRKCIVAWLIAANGICHAAVSSGKTAMFAAVAEMILRKFPKARLLYFTPTERLVRQSCSEMRKFLPGRSISQFGGGEHNKDGQIVVATNAIMWRHFKELREKWLKSFMAALADESHHVCAPSVEKILLEMPAYFRLGASDSKREADPVKYHKIVGLLGPYLETIEASDLIELGRSARPIIYVVDVQSWKDKHKDLDHTPQPDTDAWALIGGQWKRGVYVGPAFEPQTKPDEVPVKIPNVHLVQIDGEVLQLNSRWCLLNRLYDKGIIRFRERNELIAQWAAYYSGLGYQTLVVATRTLHVYILESLIAQRVHGCMVRVLFSEHDSRERDRTFKWLKETPGAILISPLLREGVSINELRAGIIADPVADFEVARQLIGRFIRKKKDDNRAFITWFLDHQHPTLRRNGMRLFKYLETVRGFTFVHPVQGPETISSGIRYETIFDVGKVSLPSPEIQS